MNVTAIFKALSNEHRLQILLWLKDPQRYFAPERLSGLDETSVAGGVCVNAIVEKIGLTQPVVSTYLTVLKDVGLIRTERAGKWTYCFYQPESMAEFSSYLNSNF
jgi:transcriptional regulator, ArsR family